MENYDNPEFSRVNYWAEQFKNTLNEIIELQASEHPDVDSVLVRESYILNKLAVLTVANEMLGERLHKLEAKFEALKLK